VLLAVADQLPRYTVELAAEMIDANEPGVALETICDMLAESRGRLSRESFALVRSLAETMGLDEENVERLRPLVGNGEG
jgi:hypothetical protein